MLKSLLVFIFLLSWFFVATLSSCLVVTFYILLFTTLLTISLSEMKVVKKYALADAIFHENTSLFWLVKSVWFTLFISLLIAFATSILFLITSTYFDFTIFFVLGVDTLIIWFIYANVKKRLQSRIKDVFLDAISRRWTIWINTLILIVFFVIYEFFHTPSFEVNEFNCNILNLLSSTLRYKELLEWKLMSNANSFLIWLLYLFLSQGVFAWAYSRLLLSMSIPTSIIHKAKDKNYFFIGFIATILLLLLATISINKLYEKYHLQSMQTQINRAYEEVDKVISLKLDASEEHFFKEIDSAIDSQVDKIFVDVYGSIPKLSDYYYSVKGEYSRIILKGYSLFCAYNNDYLAPYYNEYLPDGYKLQKCNPKMLDDEIESKINSYLFKENDFETRLDVASKNIEASIKNSMNNFQQELNKSLTSLELEHKIKATKLSADFSEIFEASSRDVAKKGLSATGTFLISGAISKSIMSKMLLKFGAKGAAKATTFIGGATTGLGICAPSGPWALLCGVVTGTASWVGVDMAMTEIDQAFNEDEFELSVRKMIDAQKNSLKVLMKDSYKAWVVKIFQQLKSDTKKFKSPYEMVK